MTHITVDLWVVVKDYHGQLAIKNIANNTIYTLQVGDKLSVDLKVGHELEEALIKR